MLGQCHVPAAEGDARSVRREGRGKGGIVNRTIVLWGVIAGIYDMVTMKIGRVILCEIHVDGGRNHAVVQGILPVTPVVRGPSAQVADDTLE